jgi:hypothetical protein
MQSAKAVTSSDEPYKTKSFVIASKILSKIEPS